MWEQFTQKIENSLTDIWHTLSDWANEHVLSIIFIVVGAFIIQRILTRVITKAVKRTSMRHDLFPTETDRKKRVQTLNSLVGALMHIVVWIVAGLLIIHELGINTAPLIASAGIIGIALGFGAQSLIKDFTSGLFIIIENQYRVGDVIEIGDVSGVVETITIRTTSVRDLDGDLHHVPNGSIVVTTNKTMHYARINEDITVARNTDLDELEHVINHVGQQLAEHSVLGKVIIEPPKFERVVRFSGDGIVIKILGKTTAGEQWAVSGEMYKRLKKAFEKHHIEVPHPQLTIHNKK